MFNKKAGTWVSYTGYLYTMRDGTLKRMLDDNFQFDEIYPVYFCGPSFKGKLPLGACGPTTTARMEKFFPWLIDKGITAIIGKGSLSQQAIDTMKGHMVYLLAVGGAGAFYGEKVKRYETVAYEELGPEALLKVYVEDMPLLIGVDAEGSKII
jgi:fumarate hydratase subunit beta